MNKTITNALRFLFNWCASTTTDDDHSFGYHGVTSSTVGVSALAQHLLEFEITSKVPGGLSKHVTSSKKAQSNWYRKLLKAWRATNPPPRTPEEASRLVIQALQGHKGVNLEGLLSFYGLPFHHTPVEITTSEVPQPTDGLKFELHTLPVDARAVGDGDGVTVHVSISDSRESSLVPPEVKTAALKLTEARAERNLSKADALKKEITDAGYGVIHINNQETVARKYRIRLRGIDAPENAQAYGKEAKDELVKIIGDRCLKIKVYGEDQYGRFVGDVYCDGIFVQKLMLENGLAWHYIAYDKRPQLEKWEKAARARRIGLWASSDPEKPWEWRRNHPRN